MDDAQEILAILDRCCDAFTFPALDNGYVYPAASRLSLFRSVDDWALVIEVFGYSPRAGLPDTWISTFASRLQDRERAQDRDENSHNAARAVFPVEAGAWIGENNEVVAPGARELVLRGRPMSLPDRGEYAARGIRLQSATTVHIFELARYLACVAREQILATATERRISVRPEMKQLLQLEEWHHPDVTGDERPSASMTFRQLALVLATGDVGHYQPSEAPNTHWANWPEGGTL